MNKRERNKRIMIKNMAKCGAKFVYQYIDDDKKQESEIYEYGIYCILSTLVRF